MSTVTDIWLFVQTATSESANSAASLNLIINGMSGIVLPTSSQQNSANTLNKLGAPAQFHWSQGTSVWPAGAITTDNILGWWLQIAGDHSSDAWLPSSIWVVVLIDTGQYMLGPQCPNWPSNQCFSTESSDCDGNAQEVWPLDWSISTPIVEFTSGGITENELEPSEVATYQFNAVNLSPLLTINNMVLAIIYDQAQYQADGVNISKPDGPSGYPEIVVLQSLAPGGSVPVSFQISTSNAVTQNYTFAISLLSWQLGTFAVDNTQLYVDDPHQFAVVPT